MFGPIGASPVSEVDLGGFGEATQKILKIRSCREPWVHDAAMPVVLERNLQSTHKPGDYTVTEQLRRAVEQFRY